MYQICAHGKQDGEPCSVCAEEVRRSRPPVRVDAVVGWRPACDCKGATVQMPQALWYADLLTGEVLLRAWKPPRCMSCATDFQHANAGYPPPAGRKP